MSSIADQAMGSLNGDESIPHATSAGPIPTTPAERLNLSRARIRQNMDESLRLQSIARQRRDSGSGAHWLDGLKSIPGGSLLIDAVDLWWSKQPLRAVAKAAVGGVKAVLQPVAQRHPLALVACAFALGGVIALSRPWRWVSKPIVLTGLLAPLLSKVVSSMPSGIWAEAFNSWVRNTQHRPPDPP